MCVDHAFPNHVCRMHKSIYGLKQAPRAWYTKFKTHLLEIGFVNSQANTSLFIYHANGHITYLLLYLDDIILTGSSSPQLQKFINKFRVHFAMKDLGLLHYFLGIEIVSNK